MKQIFLSVFQTAVVILLAPFVVGLIRRIKAFFQGRKGASPFLAYWTLATLLKKEMVISPTTSWVFRATPYGVLGTAILLTLLLPLVVSNDLFDQASHFMVIAGVLMLGSMFLVLGGLDAGSAFGGMGSSREMTFAALLEPSVIMSFVSLSIATGTSLIQHMLLPGSALVMASPALLPALLALGLISLAENARYPVDNPATHLELTMVHEAMILEYSGPYLAMLELASAIKLTVFALLISNLVFAAGLLTVSSGAFFIPIAIAAAVIKVSLVAGSLALLESTIPKMRFYRVQEYLAGAFFCALASAVAVVVIKYI